MINDNWYLIRYLITYFFKKDEIFDMGFVYQNGLTEKYCIMLQKYELWKKINKWEKLKAFFIILCAKTHFTPPKPGIKWVGIYQKQCEKYLYMNAIVSFYPLSYKIYLLNWARMLHTLLSKLIRFTNPVVVM